jgi:hypothetical protein
MGTGRRVFIRKEALTCLNPRVPRIPLFFTLVGTPTLKSSRKTMTYHRVYHFHIYVYYSVAKLYVSKFELNL